MAINADGAMHSREERPASPGVDRARTSGWDPCGVKWLSVGAQAPSPEQAVERWHQLVLSDPGATLHFHPSLVQGPVAEAPQPPIVYADWQPGDGEAKLCSLAVLAAEDREVRVLPRLPWRLRLKGRRVLENRVIGDSGEASLRRFAQSIAGMLARGESDCIVFQDLDVDGPLRLAMEAVARREGLGLYCPGIPSPHRWIRFPQNAEAYWSQFSKKTRYNFRYRAKHLEHTVRSIRDESQVPVFIEKLREFVTRTWQYRQIADPIPDPDRALAFWRRVAAMGALRSYLLEQGDRVLAFALGTQWKGVYVFEQTGYDPEFAAKSAGQVLLCRVLEDLVAHDTPAMFDFGYGDGEYKRIFANHFTVSGPLVIVGRQWRARAAMRLAQYQSALGRGARAAAEKLGVLSILRHVRRGRYLPSK